MREPKNACPVCFTKMKPHKDGLMCPECGYKLCDHRQNRDIFDTNHTHTPEYTTYKTAQSSSAQSSGTTQSSFRQSSASKPAQSSFGQSSASIPPQTVRSGANGNPGGKAVSKIIRTIVILYIFYLFMSVIGHMFF